jgi:hypothetical protein
MRYIHFFKVNQNVDTTHTLCIDSKVLSAAVKHFQNSEVDITLDVTTEKVLLKTHSESCRGAQIYFWLHDNYYYFY